MSKLSESLIHLAASDSQSARKKLERTVHKIARELEINPNGIITTETRERITEIFLKRESAFVEELWGGSIEDASRKNREPTPDEIEE